MLYDATFTDETLIKGLHAYNRLLGVLYPNGDTDLFEEEDLESFRLFYNIMIAKSLGDF